MKIRHQNPFILSIIGALKTCIIGQGIRELHHIKIDRGEYDTSIEFTRKDGEPVNTADFFMFGYFVGRDY